MSTHAGKHLDALDGLCGVAAASAMLYHLTAWYPFLNGHRLPIAVPRGIFGIELFFIISGFVIFMMLEGRSSL